MDNKVNGAGRGFNIITLKGHDLSISKVTNMDTYKYGEASLFLIDLDRFCSYNVLLKLLL